jgi:hypothetical protein
MFYVISYFMFAVIILGHFYKCWSEYYLLTPSLTPKVTGSNPAEAIGFLKGDKNPQRTFLRKGSKIIGPMSQICGMLKNPGYISQASSGRHFLP